MAFIDPCSAECIKSELDFFDIGPTQTSIDETRVEYCYPLTSLDGSGHIEFRVNVGMDEFIDLNDVWIYTRSKILDGDGKALADHKTGVSGVPPESVVFPVNYYNGSIFRQVEVSLNASPLPSCALYPYRALMETMLSYSWQTKKQQLKAGLFEDANGNNPESVDPLGADETNEGVKARFERTKYSKEFECLGRIHSELFEQPKLLLNKVTLGIKFQRSDPKFILMSKKGVEANYRISIEQAILLVTVKRVASHVREAIETRLLETNAKYNLRRVEMKFFTKGAGRSDVSVTNLCNGVIPSHIIMGMVETDSFNGSLNKNPFNFQSFSATEISIQRNGMDVPFKPLKLNFTGSKEVLLAYFQLMHSLGYWNKDKDNGISPLKGFSQGGQTLFAVNLTQDMSHGGNLNLIQEGVVSLNLRLKEGLTQSITIIVYLVYPSAILEINKNREIFFNE